MLKLFKVIGSSRNPSPFVNDNGVVIFIVAGNEIEVKRIVEEEIWFEIKIKSIEEIDMSLPQFLCSYETENI